MPTSILDIDVDTAKFDRFAAAFQKYNEALDKIGGKWGAAGKEIGRQNEFVNKMLAGMLAQNDAQRRTATEGERFSRAVVASNLSMTKLVRETHQIARNIASATLDLAKWTGIGALLGGAGGVFSLWGISRLAGDAAGALRGARGLGVATAEQQAFGVNYQRAVDPNALLSNIAGAKSDYTKRWAFQALGIQDADRKDPAELAVEMTERARRMYLGSDRSLQYAQAHGLTEFFSMDELRRLGAMPEDEMRRMRSGYRQDVGAFAVDPAVQTKWQDFTTQLDRAKTKIEDTFVVALGPLEPSLEKFSADLSDAIKALMSNPRMKEWITELGGALKTAADYLGSDDFVMKMRSFGTGIEQLAAKIGSVLGWFGITGTSGAAQTGAGGSVGLSWGGAGGDKGVPGGATPADMPTSWYPRPGYKNPITGLPWFETPDPMGDAGGVLPATRRWLMGHGFSVKGVDARGVAHEATLTALERSRSLPTGLLDSTWFAESGRGANPGLSSAGALGDFQIMPDTARQYGITNRTDFDQEARGAADFFKDLLAEFHNNLREAVAAYNVGPSAVEGSIRQYGNAWLQHLPTETQNYVEHVTGGVRITVENNTGGSTVISTAQLPG